MDSYDVHVHPIQFQLLKRFFLDYPIYLQARTTLIDNIKMVTTCYTLDIKFLTCGNVNLTYALKKYIKGMQLLYIAMIMNR
jgi:hypothetical protein